MEARTPLVAMVTPTCSLAAGFLSERRAHSECGPRGRKRRRARDRPAAASARRQRALEAASGAGGQVGEVIQ